MGAPRDSTGPKLTQGKSGAVLWVRVQPRAKREGIMGLHGGMHGDLLKVALNAPPVDGAPNEALTRFLAGVLRVPPSSVGVVVGQSSREKAVEFSGLPLADATQRLAELLVSAGVSSGAGER